MLKTYKMLNYRLKNYFPLLAFGLLGNLSLAQNQPQRASIPSAPIPSTYRAGSMIDVNMPQYPASAYTPLQMIQNVLMTNGGGTGCATPNISNVVMTPNVPVTNPNRPWGYFNKGTATYPFADGLILSTGYAVKAGNTPKGGTLSDNLEILFGNGGDQDLSNAINVPVSQLNDAVSLEFDFVPTATQMKFNYHMASDEYTGSFPCSYADGFALLLKKVGDPNYTNIAILPAGGGPVSVTNIRPANNNTGGPMGCPPMNPTYFAGYNTNPPTGDNFNGKTIPLTAMATVIPGQTYHIKMVVADKGDNSYDTAVFLEGGSFNIGVQILGPGGVALPPSINMCDNTPQTLTASIQTAGTTYQWFLGTTPIPGATSPTITVNQGGDYSVEAMVPGNNCPSKATITVVAGTSPTVQDTTLTNCSGNNNFNLTLSQPGVTSTPNVTYLYYTNQADALVGNVNNSIPDPLNFNSPGNQSVYVQVSSGFCSKVAKVDLVVADPIVVDIVQPGQISCTNSTVVLDATASTYPAGAVFSWVASAGGTIYSNPNTLTPTVSSAGTYTLTISRNYQPGDTTCSGAAAVNVTDNLIKPVTQVTTNKVKICKGESVTLTATGGVTYNWTNIAGTGGVQVVSPSTTTTFTVYAVGANGCPSINPATIKIEVEQPPVSSLKAISGQICQGDEITLDAGAPPAGSTQTYTYLWDSGETTQTITTGVVGPHTVTIDNGTCTKSFTTQVVQALPPHIKSVEFNNHVLSLWAYNPSNGPLMYSIDGGFTWQDSNVFTNVPNNVTIFIKVKLRNTSCESTLEYFTFNMNNVITPNGDGQNDVVDFTGISVYKGFTASIFDRYGKELFKTGPNKYIWDGKFQTRTLPSATYWYKINYEDPASKEQVNKSGWIMLKNRE